MSDCGGCANARDRCGNGLEKIYPTTAVRYGRMGLIGEFTHDADVVFTCGAHVVIQTDRGIEVGRQVSLTCNGCEKAVSREQMRAYAKASGGDAYRLNNGRILREATPSDLVELRHIDESIFDKIKVCRRMAEELGLPMKIVDAEHVFGGERIIFYFMAEDRIDFRELVRLLAREFQTRIEMRQVGARDEARLLADYETCGRECCCKNFLKTLKPVGMQMAKLQKATLDPSKVSGRCGRLKCCLRYEHESYAELNKKLPRVGRRVRTASEEGVVIDRQILTQLLRLRKDDGTIVTVCEEDIVERDLPAPPMPQSEGEPAGNGRRDRGRGERGSGDAHGSRRDRGRDGGRDDRRRQADRNREEAQAPAEPVEEEEVLEQAEVGDEIADESVSVMPANDLDADADTDAEMPEDEVATADEQPERHGSGPAREPSAGNEARSGRGEGSKNQNRRKGRGRRRRRRGGGGGGRGPGPSAPGSPG